MYYKKKENGSHIVTAQTSVIVAPSYTFWIDESSKIFVTDSSAEYNFFKEFIFGVSKSMLSNLMTRTKIRPRFVAVTVSLFYFVVEPSDSDSQSMQFSCKSEQTFMNLQ
ncbi:hypothetical protein PHYBLDRAFT_172529 [Phycomyces blakesleeanus NRRL 1555(-)]|uniref:Uncharacterized protein n=1 Tax=Phycomyces blakesleeanus (strain ATCC 8743b / DSM 1359 / FGSC 10004 / NBRC 33097 / NRRL 1555) TaxID=763407 RepID=A0A167L026_PHYB8|nr:hypothetical protein PHYBLDRAFT_172529 [Phycomyces blakesleeanus NRRL 1555(-)]OAD69278.1 hypothetical protein PHYBLDRAFT_172529 [Phycomyces blakesleeanus NRRL 1555(-)]|eukprot:XP_018287318.1 hypothetical protein PHYBLDRAFT_172529 [Phycomyces blakesleeanus NRRL 1555(-)]